MCLVTRAHTHSNASGAYGYTSDAAHESVVPHSLGPSPTESVLRSRFEVLSKQVCRGAQFGVFVD
jgi:hypothetical protein